MGTSIWRDGRLNRLFQRYNRLYWDCRIRGYSVAFATLGDICGRCESKKKLLSIDLANHHNDREVRETLLHEMAHAAARDLKGDLAHGVAFWGQVERLLRRGAPIRISCAEMPGHGFVATAIPSRFPLSKGAVRRLASARERRIPKDLPTHEITDQEIVNRFEDAAMDSLKWKSARLAVGMEYGLIDVGGHPVNAWARRVIAKGRNAHRRSRSIVVRNRHAGEALGVYP